MVNEVVTYFLSIKGKGKNFGFIYVMYVYVLLINKIYLGVI